MALMLKDHGVLKKGQREQQTGVPVVQIAASIRGVRFPVPEQGAH